MPPRRAQGWRVALEQDVAPQAMEVGVREMLSRLHRDRESLVDQRQGGVGASRRSLKLGEHSVEQWRDGLIALIEIVSQRLPKRLSPDLRVVKPTARPTSEGCPLGNIGLHSMLSTKRMRNFRRAKHGARVVAFGVE